MNGDYCRLSNVRGNGDRHAPSIAILNQVQHDIVGDLH